MIDLLPEVGRVRPPVTYSRKVLLFSDCFWQACSVQFSVFRCRLATWSGMSEIWQPVC